MIALGVSASVFFLLTAVCLIILFAYEGLGAAVRDSVLLFAAPSLALFEFGLWYFAPEDMTWHVTSFLWMGGVNDGGHRAVSLAAGVTYYPLNNWLVLAFALLLLGSSVPDILKGTRRQARA